MHKHFIHRWTKVILQLVIESTRRYDMLPHYRAKCK